MIDILLIPGFPLWIKLIQFILVLLSLLIAIVIHEFSHAHIADRLGDPTARSHGRLSFNPLAHLDPIGTMAIILIGFGWGKPVPFDPYNLKNPRRDSALIGLAGPLSNFLIAIVSSLLLNLFAIPVIIQLTLIYVIQFNLMLGLFNLIPIHPLDGGKILIGFLPKQLAYEWNTILNQYGIIILLFLILPITGTSPVASLILPIINFLLKILVPASPIGILT